MAAVPYFTAHAYSLDDMRPTAPRCDMPNPFVRAAQGEGRRREAGRGERQGEDARGSPASVGASRAGVRRPRAYPFALLKATPSLGTEHLVAPIGAGAIGVFSLATGAMVADAEATRDAGGGHVAELRVLRDYHHPGAAAPRGAGGGPGGGGAPGVGARCLLAVAGSGGA